MKIKYIGNFTDGTGWAKASTYNALALDAAGYDVYCQQVKYNNANVIIEDKILELLNKQSNQFDYTLQNVLPFQYVRYPNTINVGCLPLETTLSHPIWLKNISMMDMMFVPDKISKQMLIDSGVKSEIKIFNYSFNYDRLVNYENKKLIRGIDNMFNFIFIGEFTARKDLENLIRAFHGEFNVAEPVNLILKVNKDSNTINSFISEVKRRMKKPGKMKNEIVISDYLNESDLISITKQCHCFVTSSHGEAWCYPAAEAMALGLSLVYPENTGIDDYAEKGENFGVKSFTEYCYGATDGVDGLYTSDDKWMHMFNSDLRSAMRLAYNNFLKTQQLSKINSELMQKYDYNNKDLTKELFA
jgi:glycosyltransferase involved in cell wall biosynthesis